MPNLSQQRRQLADVNTTDVPDAIALGCQTMQNVFNADDNDIPFMGSSVMPNARLYFSPAHSECHVPGRHLNALLMAEKYAGVHVNEDAIAKHAQAAYFSYSGPIPLPLNRQEIGGPLINFYAHNIREGFHALYALAAFRGDGRAAELAERSIRFILDEWCPRDGWSDAIERAGGVRLLDRKEFVSGIARTIGPLVKFHRATGSQNAIELALLLKELALVDAYPADGAYHAEALGTHPHSITCTLSSLAQLADFLDDRALLERVRAFYDNGAWAVRDGVGWCIESTQAHRPADRGEVNSSGDLVEAALILGRRTGDARYYADAERIVRCHILPSQLRDVSFIVPPPNPNNEDGLRDVANRHRGAFGFPAPYGHCPIDSGKDISFNMDIVGGTVASLVEVIREAVTPPSAQTGNDAVRVNLLLDLETADVTVNSPYTSNDGTLRLTMKRSGALAVRVPQWAREVSSDLPSRRQGDYLEFDALQPGREVAIRFNLPEQELVLKHRTHDIRALLRGDAPLRMENFGTDLIFFGPL